MIVQTPSKHNVNLEEAFAYCAEVTNAHYENFPVASLFLPKEKRPYIQSIYAFARQADDYADEGNRRNEERLALLDSWERQLKCCYEPLAPSEDTHPVFVALRETVRRLDIPIEPLLDLLTAFKMDVTKNRFTTFDEVLHYCRHSANPVGRLVLIIFGYRNEELWKLSDHICTALQLTNFWQDIAVDFQKNRIYIPQVDLERFGYTERDFSGSTVDDRFTALLRFEIERTRELFYNGAELPTLVDKDLRLELKLVWFGGLTILKKIERLRYDVFRRRPAIHAGNKLAIFLNALFRRELAKYGKTSIWDLT
jgi:squalene synthase HpnC